MTYKEKKRYLQRAYMIERRVQAHKEELQRLRDAVNQTGAPDGMPRAQRWNGDTAQTSKVLEIVDLELQIEREIVEMKESWKEIHDTVERLTNINERLVLRMRYLCGYVWKEIADEMDLSERQILRIHARAIEHLEPPEPRGKKCQ